MKRRASLAEIAGVPLISLVLVVLLTVGGYYSFQICMDQKRECRQKLAELRLVELVAIRSVELIASRLLRPTARQVLLDQRVRFLEVSRPPGDTGGDLALEREL